MTRALEPAAMMPIFAIASAALRRLRTQQEPLAAGRRRTAGHAEFYAAHAAFHEGLAGLSGNRLVVQTIARQDQLRRLVEYEEIDHRDRDRRQCEERLAIIGLLERGERAGAATLLAEYPTHAGREKVEKLREALSRIVCGPGSGRA